MTVLFPDFCWRVCTGDDTCKVRMSLPKNVFCGYCVVGATGCIVHKEESYNTGKFLWEYFYSLLVHLFIGGISIHTLCTNLLIADLMSRCATTAFVEKIWRHFVNIASNFSKDHKMNAKWTLGSRQWNYGQFTRFSDLIDLLRLFPTTGGPWWLVSHRSRGPCVSGALL